MITITEIEDRLTTVNTLSNDGDYIKGVLTSYGIPNASISRTDFSDANLKAGIQVGRQAFFVVSDEELREAVAVQEERCSGRRQTRFIVALNCDKVLALDTLTGESIFFNRNSISDYADFFLPLCGREKSTVKQEERIDAKIGARMASLFNMIMMLNQGVSGDAVWSFLASLIQLFATNSAISVCKDQELFRYLDTHSNPNGDDFYKLISGIMLAANGTEQQPGIVFVDNRLFRLMKYAPLKINSEIRDNIIELASMPWMKTKSDYMGQIMQSVIVDGSTRITSNYTTSDNVHRVIDPLFMDELNNRLDACGDDTGKLEELRKDILNIWLYDPSCCSAEFLVVAWDGLNEILRVIGEKTGNVVLFPITHINGIVGDEKGLIVAQLNLFFTALKWLGSSDLPEIRSCIDCFESITIVVARSLIVDWDTVCHPEGKVYVIGNWPYAGARRMSDDQKKDMNTVFAGYRNYGDVDYAGAYFLKAVKYIQDKDGEVAFVTTNSLTQGKQVVQLWPIIYDHGVKIRFAYQSFKWSNEGNNQTTVTVVILGITKNKDDRNNYIYVKDTEGNPVKRLVKNISPYLVPGDQMITDLREPISPVLPAMVKGNMPYGAEYFSFTPEEREEAIEAYPEIDRYLKVWIGADEMLGGKERYCLWIRDDEAEEAKKIPIVNDRLLKCRESRLNKSDAAARKLASRPHSFREQNETTTQSIALPQLSSENYELIPIDIYGPEVILTNLAFAVYDCEDWVFGVLASTMHNVWIRTVCGGYETRIRYSETLGYNTFPFPKISEEKKKQISNCVADIFEARESNVGLSLGEMYKKGRMPENLIQAHHRLDLVIDGCYRKDPFVDDQDRIYHLFDMYEQMKGER